MSKYPVGGYGEVDDLLDKIKLYSNLKMKARLTPSTREAMVIYDEGDDVLEQIEKDLNELVFACMDGGWI